MRGHKQLGKAPLFFTSFMQRAAAKIHKSSNLTDRAWIELNVDHLRSNICALQCLLPQDCLLMPVLKANAYGHSATLIARELNKMGIKAFCVATVSEGVELRRSGIQGEILILGFTHPDQLHLLRKYSLTQTVIDREYAERLDSYGKKLKVHLKIDTGMHRLGERAERIEEICKICRLENLIIEGIFTHLCADETTSRQDREFTTSQAEAFFNVLSALKKRGYSFGKVHMLASYGLLNYPEYAGNLVRVGIALYGVLSNRTDLDKCKIALQPVLTIKARIAVVKDLRTGETAGYGRQYVAKSPRRIATLAIGYADGIPRALSCGHGKVLIHGKTAPIIGRICMDQTIIDVTDIPEAVSGEIAVMIGESGEQRITAYDWAEASGTITNEILSRLGSRLNRIII